MHAEDRPTPAQVAKRREQVAAYMSGLMEHAGWQIIESELGRRVLRLREEILGGELEREEYLRKTGELRALESTLRLPAELTSRQAEEARHE